MLVWHKTQTGWYHGENTHLTYIVFPRKITSTEQQASYVRSDQVRELAGSLPQISAVPEPTVNSEYKKRQGIAADNLSKLKRFCRQACSSKSYWRTSWFLSEVVCCICLIFLLNKDLIRKQSEVFWDSGKQPLRGSARGQLEEMEWDSNASKLQQDCLWATLSSSKLPLLTVGFLACGWEANAFYSSFKLKFVRLTTDSISGKVLG